MLDDDRGRYLATVVSLFLKHTSAMRNTYGHGQSSDTGPQNT